MTRIEELNRAIEAALEAAGLDARHCHAAVETTEPDGSVVLECSDADVLADVTRRAGEAADGVLLKLLDGSDPDLPEALVVASGVAGVRRTPSHAAELLTQAICGDPVTPLKFDGEWYLARLTDPPGDGYLGWIRAWHLAERRPDQQNAFAARAGHRVATNHALVLEAPDSGATPASALVIGTRLCARGCGERGWRRVELADGREGYLPARSVEKIPSRRASRDRVAALALRFLGVPYLWGGTTPMGFDCSGLVQRVFRLGGIDMPRDSDLQARVGRLIPPDARVELPVGALMFFGGERVTHVALALGDGTFVHAYGQVRPGSLDPAHPFYEPRLHRIWRHSCDPFVA